MIAATVALLCILKVEEFPACTTGVRPVNLHPKAVLAGGKTRELLLGSLVALMFPSLYDVRQIDIENLVFGPENAPAIEILEGW